MRVQAGWIVASSISKKTHQPAMLLAENNNYPAKAERVRHGATFPAHGARSQALEIWFMPNQVC
jgi:hypothetical protein